MTIKKEKREHYIFNFHNIMNSPNYGVFGVMNKNKPFKTLSIKIFQFFHSTLPFFSSNPPISYSSNFQIDPKRLENKNISIVMLKN